MSEEGAGAATAAAEGTTATTTTTTTTASSEVEVSTKAKVIKVDAKDCPMECVTVFCEKAEIVRNVKVTVDAPGSYDIAVEGLTRLAVDESIHVSGGIGAATVLEVYSKREMKTIEECKPADKNLEERQARLQELKQKLRTLNIQRTVTERTLGWLNTWADKVRSTPVNQAKSDPTFLTAPYIENVRNFGKFFAEETLKHSSRMAQLSKDMDEVKAEISGIEKELHQNDSRGVKMELFVTAVVSLAVQKATTVAFQLKYLVNRAEWTSAYDCHVSSEGKMGITYYGEIKNETMENWEHTRLFLSTASPSVGGHPGELRLATVSIYEPREVIYPMRSMMMNYCAPPPPPPGAPMCFGMGAAPPPPPAGPAPEPMKVLTATSSKSLASCTFTINRKATIASDSEKHRVTIAMIADLPTKLNYVCTPSETEHVFLKASAVNKTEFPLLEGPCNTFIDGCFVASSTFKYTAIGEPFKFYLGTDQELRLKYVKPFRVDDKAGIIMKSTVQKFNGSVELRNGKSIAVNVTVYHPLPKSDNTDIKVALTEPKIAKDEKAVKIDARNMIRWKSKVNPGETFKMPIVYTITYPQGKDVYFHT